MFQGFRALDLFLNTSFAMLQQGKRIFRALGLWGFKALVFWGFRWL